MKNIKESRKPFKENEATYQWISQFLASKGLEMKRDFEDQDGYFIKQNSKTIGYLIVNPVEYYLAGEDESCYYEGNICDEFIEDFNDCFNSLNLLEGKRKVREMARTIKDYDTFEGKGLSPNQKGRAFQKFVDFLEYIGATWEAPNIEKQVSGKFWDLEFTLNYAGMGGRGYTIDVMNVTDGTIQDQWVGDTYSDFLADFEELKNEYCDLYTDVDDPENLKESRRINESIFWKKKFERKIKQRVVGVFQDWVDEDNPQGVVEEFDIDPDNAVEELIDEILENEADEIHEGRYKEFLRTIVDEDDVGQDEIEEVGEAYLDKLEDLDIKTKRRIFGSSYCNKLEKQMKGVSASGDNE